MTARQNLFCLCERMKVEVGYTPGGIHLRTREPYPYEITLDPPPFHIFAATGLHCDCGIRGNDGDTKTDWADALKMVESVLSGGIVRCTEPDCEYCEDQKNDRV